MTTNKAVVHLHVVAFINTTPQRPNWQQCGENVAAVPFSEGISRGGLQGGVS